MVIARVVLRVQSQVATISFTSWIRPARAEIGLDADGYQRSCILSLIFSDLATRYRSCRILISISYTYEKSNFEYSDLNIIRILNVHIQTQTVGCVQLEDEVGWDIAIHGYWDKDIHDACLVEWMGRVIFLFGWMDESG